jgi:hypothetical protein
MMRSFSLGASPQQAQGRDDMTIFDLQKLCFDKVERGELGNVEYAGFSFSNFENPLQMQLRDLDKGGSLRIVGFNWIDGAIVSVA